MFFLISLGWVLFPLGFLFLNFSLLIAWQPFKFGGPSVIHVKCIQKETLGKRGKKDDKISATDSESEFMWACLQFYFLHKQLSSRITTVRPGSNSQRDAETCLWFKRDRSGKSLEQNFFKKLQRRQEGKITKIGFFIFHYYLWINCEMCGKLLWKCNKLLIAPGFNFHKYWVDWKGARFLSL